MVARPERPVLVAAAYLPCIDRTDPTEVFVIEVEGQAAGLIERYLVADDPQWNRALQATGAVTGCAAGIDYLIGEAAACGRGYGTAAISLITALTFRRYPRAEAIVAAPQQANIGSWRALERAGISAGGAACSSPATRPMRARPTCTGYAARRQPQPGERVRDVAVGRGGHQADRGFPAGPQVPAGQAGGDGS